MKTNIVIVLLFVTAIALYALTMKGIAGNPDVSMVKGDLDQSTRPLELSPERGRYLLTQSLGEYGSFALPQAYADAAYPDVGYNDGRFYVYFAPGMSMFALPFYYVGKYFGYSIVGAFSISTVFALLNLIVLYKLGREALKLSVPHSLISPIIFGFASTSWSYAVTLYQHHASTFYILSSLYAVWLYSRKTRHSWVWAVYVWFSFACALLVDYPNAFLMLPVMMYFFVASFDFNTVKQKVKIHPRATYFVTSIVFVLITLAHGYFNSVHYGGWTRVAGSLVGYKAIIEKQLLTTPQSQAEFNRIESTKNPIGFFSEYNFPFGIYTLTFSSDRGLFVYYPIYLLAIGGIYIATKRMNAVHRVLLATSAINFFLYASFGDPWGGWAFGSRYLILSMAILALYISLWSASVRNSLVVYSTVGMTFVYSLAIALVGVLTTNAVPPKIEADFLKMKHNFMLNIDTLMDGRSSSVVYNEFFKTTLPITTYYLILFFTVCVIFFGILIWSRRYRYE
jgi:hypothetical protein